jgi:hypothetical protein
MGEPRNNCTHTACSYRRDRPVFPLCRRQRRNRRLPGSRKGQKRIRYRRRFPAILVLGRYSPRRINYRLPQRFPAATLQHPDYLFNQRIFPANSISNSLVNCRRKNHKRTDFETVKDQLKQLRQAVTQKTIWLPAAFLFLLQATPSSDSAFFFFTTNELGFQPEFLGRVRLVTSIAALAGVWLFQRFLKTVPFRVIFGWSTVIASALGMTTLLLVTHANRALGIDDQWFSIGDSLILTVIGQIAYMPLLVLSARLCPRGVEATLFALLMSITNLAGILSHEGGAVLTHLLGITDRNFDNLWLLVIITNLSTLLPLLFLNWLPAESTESGDPNYQQSLPVLEPELGSSKSGGQHFIPEYFPDLVPTVRSQSRTVESK